VSACQALAALAEGKPAEAAALLEPVSFDARTPTREHLDIAKVQAGDWPAAVRA
jgi:hypothetical protein